MQRETSTIVETASGGPTWSKEALFGLLGVLVVIIVPCVGLLLKYCLFKRGWLKLWRSKSPGNVTHDLLVTM
jgi:hypothetical protein